jgi:hypothetical protein
MDAHPGSPGVCPARRRRLARARTGHRAQSAAEGLLERGAHEDNDGGVAPALRLAGDQQAVEQLDPVLRAEDAGLDELVVSNACHPPQGQRRCFHGCRHDTATATERSTSSFGDADRDPVTGLR